MSRAPRKTVNGDPFSRPLDPEARATFRRLLGLEPAAESRQPAWRAEIEALRAEVEELRARVARLEEKEGA